MRRTPLKYRHKETNEVVFVEKTEWDASIGKMIGLVKLPRTNGATAHRAIAMELLELYQPAMIETWYRQEAK